jgi:hypothetical protein|tara:strand:+ start:1743 stop:2225 length:483 start_codon:yes stop_codon:yes gene_type:complete
MEDAENQAPMSSLSLDVTVPCHARYLPMLQQLAKRTVEYIGYHESLREEVVQTIDHAVHGVFETEKKTYTDVELRLATTENVMLVRIRYLGAPAVSDGPTAIEQQLSQPAGPDGDDAPLDRLRRAMKTVELGREAGADGADYCELTRELPDDPDGLPPSP